MKERSGSKEVGFMSSLPRCGSSLKEGARVEGCLLERLGSPGVWWLPSQLISPAPTPEYRFKLVLLLVHMLNQHNVVIGRS